MRVFAEEYGRQLGDLINFPKDTALRATTMPPESATHPARNNLHMLRAIVDYVAEPGESILDPFGGVGSICAVAPNNPLILIEIEPKFAELARQTSEMNGGNAIVLEGDCRRLLPIPCAHAIFSPPFAGDIKDSTWKPKETVEDLDSYSGQSSKNTSLGKFNQFQFGFLMKRVYKLLGESVTKTLTIILRDTMRQGERQMLSLPAIKGLNEAGFELAEWHKRYCPPSSRRSYAQSKGWKTVDDEDIIIFRKA